MLTQGSRLVWVLRRFKDSLTLGNKLYSGWVGRQLILLEIDLYVFSSKSYLTVILRGLAGYERILRSLLLMANIKNRKKLQLIQTIWDVMFYSQHFTFHWKLLVLVSRIEKSGTGDNNFWQMESDISVRPTEMTRPVTVDHLQSWSWIVRSDQTEMVRSIWWTNGNFQTFGLNGKRPLWCFEKLS